MKAISRADELHVGFQIAPMIDVVFVIMLFFMVMAGAVKIEREIGTRMPRGGGESVCGDELVLRIDEDGVVSMNDEEMDDGSGRGMAKVKSILIQLARDAEARGAKVLVTLQAEPAARYQRIIDVMNCLAAARIVDVVFAVGDDD